MNKEFVKKLISLGFNKCRKDLDTIYCYDNEDKLFTTMNRWTTFVYFENDKYYISNNGDLVENFDAPDIDIYFMLKEIKNEIAKFGCSLNVSRITKEFEIEDFEKAIEDFKKAIYSVDDMYKKIVNNEY